MKEEINSAINDLGLTIDLISRDDFIRAVETVYPVAVSCGVSLNELISLLFELYHNEFRKIEEKITIEGIGEQMTKTINNIKD